MHPELGTKLACRGPVSRPRGKCRVVTTALVIVDAQRNMLEGSAPVPSAAPFKAALRGLLDDARTARSVVVHVQNDGSSGDPDEPRTAGWELVLELADNEIVVRKDQERVLCRGDQPRCAERGI